MTTRAAQTSMAVAVGLMLIGMSEPAVAEIYRYVGADGVVYYTNRPRGKGGARVRGGSVSFSVADQPAAALEPAERAAIVSRLSRTAQRHGVDPLLAKAIAKIESNFNPAARSHAGACGIMQLIPGTAARYGVTDLFDVDSNIDGGVRYFRDLLREFRDVSLALAAYNAGEGAVRRYKGIPPYSETQDYVRKVLRTYTFYQRLEGIGSVQAFAGGGSASATAGVRPVENAR